MPEALVSVLGKAPGPSFTDEPAEKSVLAARDLAAACAVMSEIDRSFHVPDMATDKVEFRVAARDSQFVVNVVLTEGRSEPPCV